MPTASPNIETLLRAFPEELFQLEPDQQRLSLGLYRLLAKGQPVAPARLADAVRLPESVVHNVLQEWPGVYYDQDRRVIGYWGLALPETAHRFVVAGRTLYSWCAWDSLFLPELIQQTAWVESSCPVTGEPIRLCVSPQGIEDCHPAESVMSFVKPNAGQIREDVIQHFCHYVHFFGSVEAGARWVSQNEGTFLLSLDQAYDLARKKNHERYKNILDVPAETKR